MSRVSLGFVAVGSSNFSETVAFYERLLGELPAEKVGQSFVRFKAAGLGLGIFRPKEENASSFSNAEAGKGSLSLSFQVEDLETFLTYLSGEGFAPSPPQVTKFGREISLQDPEGNRVIFFERN